MHKKLEMFFFFFEDIKWYIAFLILILPPLMVKFEFLTLIYLIYFFSVPFLSFFSGLKVFWEYCLKVLKVHPLSWFFTFIFPFVFFLICYFFLQILIIKLIFFQHFFLFLMYLLISLSLVFKIKNPKNSWVFIIFESTTFLSSVIFFFSLFLYAFKLLNLVAFSVFCALLVWKSEEIARFYTFIWYPFFHTKKIYLIILRLSIPFPFYFFLENFLLENITRFLIKNLDINFLTCSLAGFTHPILSIRNNFLRVSYIYNFENLNIRRITSVNQANALILSNLQNGLHINLDDPATKNLMYKEKNVVIEILKSSSSSEYKSNFRKSVLLPYMAPNIFHHNNGLELKHFFYNFFICAQTENLLFLTAQFFTNEAIIIPNIDTSKGFNDPEDFQSYLEDYGHFGNSKNVYLAKLKGGDWALFTKESTSIKFNDPLCVKILNNFVGNNLPTFTNRKAFKCYEYSLRDIIKLNPTTNEVQMIENKVVRDGADENFHIQNPKNEKAELSLVNVCTKSLVMIPAQDRSARLHEISDGDFIKKLKAIDAVKYVSAYEAIARNPENFPLNEKTKLNILKKNFYNREDI